MPHVEVIIAQGSRGGSLSYREGCHEIPFDWECCGSAAVIIWGTKKCTWNVNHPWAAGRQYEIFDFVAREVIRLRAPTATFKPTETFKIDLESGTMTLM
jgi:hypothetical protein